MLGLLPLRETSQLVNQNQTIPHLPGARSPLSIETHLFHVMLFLTLSNYYILLIYSLNLTSLNYNCSLALLIRRPEETFV